MFFYAEKENSENIQSEEITENTEKFEPYEIWKQRMLDEAYKELEEIGRN